MSRELRVIRENGPPIRHDAAYHVGQSRRPPTRREIEVFLAVVESTTMEEAARQLGISTDVVRKRLGMLYERLGAENRPHAAWLLWPVLKDRYRLPTVGGCQRVAA